MSSIYNQHDINNLIEKVDPNIEFEISYRKSDDIFFSARNKVFNPIVLAAINYVEEMYSIGTNLLSSVDSVSVDDSGPGHYEIIINNKNLPNNDSTTLLNQVFEQEFEVSVVQEGEGGEIDSHDSPFVVLRSIN